MLLNGLFGMENFLLFLNSTLKNIYQTFMRKLLTIFKILILFLMPSENFISRTNCFVYSLSYHTINL